MKNVQQGDQVCIEYEGMLDTGEIVERSSDTGPVEFEVGSGVMPPGFEKALIGMREGEEKKVILTADEAFGPRDENLLHTVKRSAFGDNIKPEPGMVLGMNVVKEGQTQKIPALVTVVHGDDVTIDFNHPLSGKSLTYTLRLKEIKG